MNFKQAFTLAAAWVDITSEGKARIMREHTISKPYGWVFFYNSKAYLDTGNIAECLIGNAPILIEKINSELRVFGTAKPVQDYLTAYEKLIPSGRLDLPIEWPVWPD